MTNVENESAQETNNIEEDVEEIVDETIKNVEEVITPKPKKSGKISKKQQRLNAIDDFKNGRENNDFKVYSLKNGSFRVVKRETPPVKIENNVESKPEPIPVINQQYTNDQFLINHILELEKKFEKLRLKQKKIKKSHKKMKADIYEDDSEIPVDLNTVSHEVVEEEPKIVETPAVEPTVIRYNKGKKLSWRQMFNQ